MPGESALDPHTILASLGITGAGTAQPITGGADTAMWRVMWHDQVYALRVFRPEQAAVCAREVRVMGAAAQAGIPVPEVIRKGMWRDRPALLLSWIAGRTLLDHLQTQPWLIWTLGKAFGRVQAAVHAIPAPPDMDPTRWIEWAGDEPELKARLYDLPSRRTALLHLDFHPLNVMAQGIQISGVLDWANTQAGDPRADFARTRTILRLMPYGPNGNSLQMTLFRRLLERAWRAGYAQAGGQADDMALFYAWAGAVMIRDLAPRISQAGFWLEDHHLDPVRRWRDEWKQRAGI